MPICCAAAWRLRHPAYTDSRHRTRVGAGRRGANFGIKECESKCALVKARKKASTTVATVEVLLPRPNQSQNWQGSGSRFSLAKKRVAIVNNGWGSADDLVMAFERILREQFDVADVLQFKANADQNGTSTNGETPGTGGNGAPAAFVAEVVASADVAITMLGNCGGCTYWTCNTSAEFERQGIYSAAVVTGLFRSLAEFSLANTNKMPNHPLVVLSDHFEHTDPKALEDAAATTLRTLFGEGSMAQAYSLVEGSRS
jgi:hypothetical protein